MPVHDWTRVDDGTFHDFHSAWIIHLKETLNEGLLPDGYYAMAEQHAGQMITDVLTLQLPEPPTVELPHAGMVAVADSPPKVSRKLELSPQARGTPRTLAIRHVSGHRIVALVEIVSPSNKDRADSVEKFLSKAETALLYGCHLLVVDLLPPRTYDPHGIPAVLCRRIDSQQNEWPDDKPMTLAAFVASQPVTAYVEHVSVGDPLPEMPLFLDQGFYINMPLEETYQAAWRGMPLYWRNVLEA